MVFTDPSSRSQVIILDYIERLLWLEDTYENIIPIEDLYDVIAIQNQQAKSTLNCYDTSPRAPKVGNSPLKAVKLEAWYTPTTRMVFLFLLHFLSTPPISPLSTRSTLCSAPLRSASLIHRPRQQQIHANVHIRCRTITIARSMLHSQQSSSQPITNTRRLQIPTTK